MTDVYQKLAKHLNKLPAGYPRTESGVEMRILRRLFSPEEAKLATCLTMIPEPTAGIAARLEADEARLAVSLEAMAQKGLIFRMQKKDSTFYSAAQFVVGIWEYHLNDLDEDLIKDFNERELTHIVVATEEMKAFCDSYCPPLTPHEVLQYIVDRKSRRPIRAKLKRIKKNYGEDYSLQPIRNCLSRIRWLPRQQKMEILLDFVKTFARYHRDWCNYNLVNHAISYINFVNDETFLRLSRANHSLYEFLLPNEKKPDEMPIISHTVLKADVRGSTGIVNEMKSQGMNPATNFSLNFFDPITSILSRFGAFKVFIEGDAIILSIFEHENQPQNWYSVGRACGLAMNTLLIVQRYNRKNTASRLPLLEIGIGISYSANAPTFFFDQDKRIMISPAINQADRLSGCFKPLRDQAALKQSPFNVFVYEIAAQDQNAAAGQYIRYNVNGIELSDDAFEKLQKEIQMEQLDLKAPGAEGEPHKLFVGKYPTVSGTSHQLVIRQAPLPIISLADLKVTGATGRYYYEVCTNPALLGYIKDLR